MLAMNDETTDVEPMSIQTFCENVQSAVEIARAHNRSGYQPQRDLVNSYYEGDVADLDVIENRSRMTSPDLRAVVSKLQPSIMRTFTSSPAIVDFTVEDPDNPEMEELAEEIQDVINAAFIENGGYQMLDAASHDSMLHDEGVFHYTIEESKISFDAIPRESVIVSPDARTLKQSVITGFSQMLTRSDLLEMGYDPEKVSLADTNTGNIMFESQTGLMTTINRIDLGTQSEEVEVYYLYVRADFDNDGIAELRRVVFINQCSEETLLENEPVKHCRMFMLRDEASPHSWRGRSIARDVMPIQKAKTALLRAAMDNLSAVNDPTTFMDITNLVDYESFMNRERGAIVTMQGPNIPFHMMTVPLTAQTCFEAMKYYDQMLIDVTGVSGAASGMMPDQLRGQTATAAAMIQSGGTARVELICRNYSELGLRPMFASIFEEITESMGVEIPLKDVTVNVGLGAGSKERDLASLNGVMLLTKELLGAFGPPENNPHVDHNSIAMQVKKFVEISGLRSKDRYFKTPTDQEIEQRKQAIAQQKSPEQEKLESDVTLEREKMAAARDKEMAQGQADLIVKKAEMDKDEQRIGLEMQAKEQEDANKLQIEREKIQSNERIAFAKLAQERELAILGHKQKAASDDEMSAVDPDTGENVASPTARMIEQMAAMVASIHQGMNAPKQVQFIKDETGRNVGGVIAPIQQGMIQ